MNHNISCQYNCVNMRLSVRCLQDEDRMFQIEWDSFTCGKCVPLLLLFSEGVPSHWLRKRFQRSILLIIFTDTVFYVLSTGWTCFVTLMTADNSKTYIEIEWVAEECWHLDVATVPAHAQLQIDFIGRTKLAWRAQYSSIKHTHTFKVKTSTIERKRKPSNKSP